MRARYLLTASLLLSSKWALAEPGFAEPPGAPLVVEDREARPREVTRPPLASSVVRLSVGPTLRFSEDATDGGLCALLDVGRGASGLRLSGAWVRAGSEGGLSQYAAELWIDFGVGQELHPVLAAGAGAARLNRGDSAASTVGIGTLRGTLEYVLPVSGADARAGLDLTGSVPAIRGSGDDDVKPWLLAVARVGVGF